MVIDALWPYWLATYATLIALWSVGQVALAALRIELGAVWSSAFAKTLTGALLSVLAFGAWTTRGRTVLVGVVVVGLCYLRDVSACRGREPPRQSHPTRKDLPWLVAVPLIVLSLLTLRFSIPDERLVFVDNPDFALYAMASDWIAITGEENNNAGANLISDAYRGLIPYHYYDLYLAKISGLSFGLLTLHAYAITATAVGAFVVYLGILALLERLGGASLTWRSHVVALLFVASTGLTLPAYYTHPIVERLLIGSFDTPALSSLNFLRSSSSQAFLLASALLVSHGRERLANGALLVLPLVNSVMAPGVLLGLFLLALVTERARQRTAQPPIVRQTVPPLLVSAFLAALYALLGAQQALRRATIFHYDSLWDVGLSFAYAFKWVLRTAVFYWPFLALAAWLLWSRRHSLREATPALRPIAARYAAILGCGLVVGSALRQNFDGIQAYSNLARECSLVLAVWLWATLGRSALPLHMRAIFVVGYGWLFIGSVVYTLQFNVLDNHSDGRRNRMAVSRPFLEQTRSMLGENRSSHEQIAAFGRWTRYPTGGALFGNLRNDVGIQQLDLTQREEALSGWDYGRLFKSSVLVDFVDRKTRSGAGGTPGEIKEMFCRDNGISLILYPSDAELDRELGDRVKVTIVDPKSGLRLARLQPWEPAAH